MFKLTGVLFALIIFDIVYKSVFGMSKLAKELEKLRETEQNFRDDFNESVIPFKDTVENYQKHVENVMKRIKDDAKILSQALDERSKKMNRLSQELSQAEVEMNISSCYPVFNEYRENYNGYKKFLEDCSKSNIEERQPRVENITEAFKRLLRRFLSIAKKSGLCNANVKTVDRIEEAIHCFNNVRRSTTSVKKMVPSVITFSKYSAELSKKVPDFLEECNMDEHLDVIDGVISDVTFYTKTCINNIAEDNENLGD